MHVPTESWKKQHICSMGYLGLLGLVEIHLILPVEGLEAVVLDAFHGGCSLTAQHTVKYTKSGNPSPAQE
jgi:hypothetical protein